MSPYQKFQCLKCEGFGNSKCRRERPNSRKSPTCTTKSSSHSREQQIWLSSCSSRFNSNIKVLLHKSSKFHSVTTHFKCLWLKNRRRNLQALYSHLITSQQLFHLRQRWVLSKQISNLSANRRIRIPWWWKTTNRPQSKSRSHRWCLWST